MLFESPRVRLTTEYGIATLAVRFADDRATLTDLESALSILDGRATCEVLILRGSDGGFGSGYHGCTDPETAELGQRVAERLAHIGPVTIAWLDGPCLGGALELALACDWRAAAGSAATRIGFPQASAGLVPCWGGTVRLPRLVGPVGALDLLISGDKLSAAQALDVGLIDRAFGPRTAAVHFDNFVLEQQRRWHKPRRRCCWARFAWIRERALRRAHERWATAISAGHRTARAVVDAVASGLRQGAAAGLAAERAAARRTAERHPSVVVRRAAPQPNHLPFERVAIVGSGTIGAALAQWAGLCGAAVVVHDCDPDAARARIRRHFEAAADKRLIDARDALDRAAEILCTADWSGFAQADLVIEAIGESQSRKRRMLEQIESVVRPSAVIATTSTVLPVGILQKTLAHPERLIGWHCAHPAAAARVVELTAGSATDQSVTARMQSWLESHGRRAVQVADRPGRVLGRVLLPYFHEALLLAAEGGRIEAIDAAAERFGWAWGPFRALDEVGLDVVRASLRGLAAAYGPTLSPPTLLKRLTRRGWLGRKIGVGFYVWDGQAARVHWAAASRARHRCDPQDALQRLVARTVHAAFAALEAGLADEETIDRVVIGGGWPAFRGGPIHYVRTRGVRRVMRQLERLALVHGERFRPTPALRSPSTTRSRAAA